MSRKHRRGNTRLSYMVLPWCDLFRHPSSTTSAALIYSDAQGTARSQLSAVPQKPSPEDLREGSGLLCVCAGAGLREHQHRRGQHRPRAAATRRAGGAGGALAQDPRRAARRVSGHAGGGDGGRSEGEGVHQAGVGDARGAARAGRQGNSHSYKLLQPSSRTFSRCSTRRPSTARLKTRS